ncbi:MAG: Dabb family protein [Clostridia bacterium]
MIKHIVMWKVLDNFVGLEKTEITSKIKTDLMALVNIIPEIKFMEVGIDESKTDMSMDIVLTTEFLTKKDLAIYANHPKHLEAGKFIKAVATMRKVIDYEV